MTSFKPIGATCTVQWEDELNPDNFAINYISFSEWEDDAERDTHGVDDNTIFFYCPNGEEELKALMKRDNGEGFWVEDYELEWKDGEHG